MSGPHDIGLELEERDAQAVKDRLKRDVTNGDKAHNALADALCWNIDHSVANLKEVRAIPDTLIKKMRAEGMCTGGISIPLGGGRVIKATGTTGVLAVLIGAVTYGLLKIHDVI